MSKALIINQKMAAIKQKFIKILPRAGVVLIYGWLWISKDKEPFRLNFTWRRFWIRFKWTGWEAEFHSYFSYEKEYAKSGFIDWSFSFWFFGVQTYISMWHFPKAILPVKIRAILGSPANG